ncbi:MAG: hypothetical protein ABIB97_03795 [Patescibacteria group bacterium]
MTHAENLFAQRKVRVLGKIDQEAEVKNTKSWVTVHDSSKAFLITYESKGLVVAINGGGGLKLDHPAALDGIALAKAVVDWGGCVINAGRDTGIMKAVAEEVKDKCLGILYTEQKPHANKVGPKAIVNMPAPRVELMAISPPVVVIFQGELGTFQILIRSVVHMINKKITKEESAPQQVFVSSYWIPILDTLINIGVFKREYLSEINFFSTADEIIAKIPGL